MFRFSKFGREIKNILPPLLGLVPSCPCSFLALTLLTDKWPQRSHQTWEIQAQLSCWVEFNGCAGDIKEKASSQQCLHSLVHPLGNGSFSAKHKNAFLYITKQSCIVKSYIQHNAALPIHCSLLECSWRKRCLRVKNGVGIINKLHPSHMDMNWKFCDPEQFLSLLPASFVRVWLWSLLVPR